MSHVTKILLRIVMMRVRNKIRPEIAEEQCGFVEGKGTSKAIFMLRTIIERTFKKRYTYASSTTPKLLIESNTWK